MDNNQLIQVGLSVNSYSPHFHVSQDAITTAENGEFEQINTTIAEWWDELSVEEKAEALQLDKTDGAELVENLLFIDQYNTKTNHFQPLWE